MREKHCSGRISEEDVLRPPQSSLRQGPVAPWQVMPYTAEVSMRVLSIVLMRREAFSSHLLGSATALSIRLASQFLAFFFMYVQIAIKTVD